MIKQNLPYPESNVPYIPNDVMNIILKFRTEEMKKQRDKLNYDKVIKELNDIHVLLYGGKISFIESKSLDCSKLWQYSSPFIKFI